MHQAFSNARVTDRFTATVAGNRVPVIEFSFPDQAGQSHTERLAIVQFPLTTIRITAKAPASFFRSCDHAFNQLVLSIRAGTQGAPAGFQQFLQDL